MTHTVILGAGIIGASTAYYLVSSSSSSHKVTILDPCPPASGASGKSGGFIARNWAGPSTSSLADLSFRLHSMLASDHDGANKWGYRRARAVGVVGKNAVGGVMGDLTRSVRLRHVEGKGKGQVDWIREGVMQSEESLGCEEDIAQCDPYLLTTFLTQEAGRRGAEFVQAEATKLDIKDGIVHCVHAKRRDGSTLSIACDNVVIAAGHSIIIRPSTTLTADCLFMTLNTRNTSYHPEIFPRTSGQLYICGVNENLRLPPTPIDAIPQPKDISKLKDIADTLFADYTLEKEQLCFRPMTQHGEPFVGPVPQVKGVYVGAGHSFWGITLGPGTGKVLAELVRNEALSADITALRL